MNILWFKEVAGKKEVVGNKGSLLADLSNKGFPIPQGFCITSDAFNIFLEENNIKEEILRLSREETDEIASERIKSLISLCKLPKIIENEIVEAYDNLNVDESLINIASKNALDIIKLGREPPFVAVRISTPFDLKQEYFLNIKGNQRLLEAVETAMIRSFTPEFVANMKNSGNIPLSVIVQKMINSKKSGIMFVKDDEIIIKTNFGFSTTVKNSEIMPDFYKISKDSLKINEKMVNKKEFMLTRTSRGETIKKPLDDLSEKQVLELEELNKLSSLAIALADYKENYEIEWTMEDNKPYILDLKPIVFPQQVPLRPNIEIEHPYEIPMPEKVEQNIEGPVITAESEIQTTTHVKLFIKNFDEAAKCSSVRCDGIGLIRSDSLVDPELNDEELTNALTEKLEIIASSFKDKPIWYRTLDYNDKNDKNPLLGYRGIRKSLDKIETLKAEFKAVKNLYDKGHTNIGITLPLITDINQIKKAKQALRDVGLEPLDEIEFGVMIETPAACSIIEDICAEGIDFINIGLNDLTQAILFLDMKNTKTFSLYDEEHPAVLKNIKSVIKACRQYNVETSVTTGNVDLVSFLVKSGIDSIITHEETIKKMIKAIEKEERKLLLEAARKDY
ncbi:hypothetical protein J4414_00870 [Candidatus Woesearchaeota archaeon]|nr:hypothetical protein [Candidatus Woesearchaeota archaeon]